MSVILCADIGSTFTKLTAVEAGERRVLGSARAFTTIATNVMEGFEAALADLRIICGPLEFSRKVASSSAAGGLKMIAVGLVPELTVQAARLAAANAGAKILKTFAYEISLAEVREIVSLGPDIVLLSGGIDGGNKDVIIHNARRLVASGLACPLVVAGNKSAADEIRAVMAAYPGEAIFCANVMPQINELNIEPAQKAIRDLFIKNIISAKGLGELQAGLSAEIIPTPLAVFEAANLLSQGTKSVSGLGELVLFDLGGATTDVYSMAQGAPTRPNVFPRGLPQPYAKRTVEGDLGVRYSLTPLAAEAGIEDVAARAGCSAEEVEDWLETCRHTPGFVPEAGCPAKRIDEEMAGAAVRLSMARHCGYTEEVFTSLGRSFAQTGKDLGNVPYVIGTGGPIINAADPAHMLAGAVYTPRDMNLLKPLSPKFLLDRKYILSAMGLLARSEPEAALYIMKEEIAAV